MNDFSFDFRPSCLPHETNAAKDHGASFEFLHSRKSTPHSRTHTYSHIHTLTSGIYSISGTRPISKDKVSFFLLFFILFTYHFSSQFRLYSHRMILSLSCILKQKSHNSFIVSSLLLSCYIFFAPLVFWFCSVPWICVVILYYFFAACILPFLMLSKLILHACIGFAWLPNIFHFGIIRARELLLCFFFFLCSFSSTHTICIHICYFH